METKLIVSSTASFSFSSLPSPLVQYHQHHYNRGLLQLPLTINPGRAGVRISRKNLSFCPKAALRGNLEAVGVPTSVPVRVAHELQQAGHRYLDVRTPEEFSAGHAVGAVNVPFMYRVGSGMTQNPKFLEEVSARFRKHDEIIVGCQLGKRSLMAAAALLADGFTAVTDIAGGYAAWTQNGLPTER
ncbi:Rhodanese-like domain-containing protein 15, chloroplastic [Turnera subulata]|uniref:Rhodanese-like domain-containing protein 15, chloroplastic n=1 Tax=Turnera subulata TaxID=218843 RepID=A0A9Q0G3G4_9ROSI|nr:Rhodanese-like domain-containing protein 15, chloroplastic [Turnera subulata]